MRKPTPPLLPAAAQPRPGGGQRCANQRWRFTRGSTFAARLASLETRSAERDQGHPDVPRCGRSSKSNTAAEAEQQASPGDKGRTRKGWEQSVQRDRRSCWVPVWGGRAEWFHPKAPSGAKTSPSAYTSTFLGLLICLPAVCLAVGAVPKEVVQTQLIAGGSSKATRWNTVFVFFFFMRKNALLNNKSD